MDCDKERIIHWLNSQLNESERLEFEIHLAGCRDCQQEYKRSQQLWDLMNTMPEPEPSPDMKIRFLGMLDAYKQSQEKEPGWLKNFILGLKNLWNYNPRMQLAYSVIILITGLSAGYFINHFRETGNSKAGISAQLLEMKQLMMLSMVENPSASKRLQAISYTDEISDLSSEIIEVLLNTLNEDPNVNVRLATLEALVKFSSIPRVREGLVQSITQQQSPLVQSAMVDVMVKLQEKRSVQPLRQLLDKNDLNQSVKTKIEKSISLLI